MQDFESLGLTPRVLDESEIEEVLAFENARVAQSERIEDQLLSWNAPWRLESLQHYVPKGWCFALRDDQGKLKGYFLAQPLLFYNGMTQTLWVEYMGCESHEIMIALVDLARRYARDKHLQKVMINAPATLDLSEFGAKKTQSHTYEFNTTKMVQP